MRRPLPTVDLHCPLLMKREIPLQHRTSLWGEIPYGQAIVLTKKSTGRLNSYSNPTQPWITYKTLGQLWTSTTNPQPTPTVPTTAD